MLKNYRFNTGKRFAMPPTMRLCMSSATKYAQTNNPREVKMSSEMNATVGSKVIVKVGCREIEAVVLEITEAGCRVKSIASGKEFSVKKILRIIEPEDTSVEVEELDAPNPAPESAPAEKPVKKLSLLDAAVEVLKTSGQPMNTREIVKAATESGLWIPTACRTPEQTLYGSIFREIATKENPRIAKAGQKGKFILG
jgi:hypothetical protein